MTSPPTPPPDTPPDPLDERLSAALDGEAEFPEPLDEATARRRRELEAARDLLAVPPPRLDDVTRRRLLRTAIDAAPASTLSTRGRTARRWRSVVVAAAVIAVIALAGLGIASLDNRSNDASSKANSAASGTTSTPGGTLDLHEISDPSVLRRRVQAALNGSSTATTNAPQVGTTTAAPSGGTTETTGVSARCVSTLKVPGGDTAHLLATATFHGTPALVVVARDPARVLVFVLARADCRLLSSQFLKQ
jgi:hypothetical protein